MPSKLALDEVSEVKEVLIDFWLELVRDKSIDVADRLRASDHLAKYVLGNTKVRTGRKPGADRPTTAEVLRLAASLERDDE